MKVAAFITNYAIVDRIIDHFNLKFIGEKPPPLRVIEQVVIIAAEERRIEKRLGIVASPSISKKSEGGEQQRAELKKKIEAAKKRGDMNELMRLAQDGQKMAAPEIAQTEIFQKKTDQQSWTLLESAPPELAEASYPTRVTFYNCPCLRCKM